MSLATRSPLYRFAFGRPDTSVRVAAWPATELIGRIMLAGIFLISGIAKLVHPAGAVGYMQSQGIPYANLLVYVAGLVEVVGGLCVLTGLMTRVASLMLFLFLIPTTLIFHDFWTMSGTERVSQMANFMKNLAVMGGLLVLMAHGAGRYALDRLHHRPDEVPVRRV